MGDVVVMGGGKMRVWRARLESEPKRRGAEKRWTDAYTQNNNAGCTLAHVNSHQATVS